jgi:outer membrane protein TolC
MRCPRSPRPAALALAAVLACGDLALGQGGAPPPVQLPQPAPACAPDRPLPINLPTALRLANVRPLDIALAAERIRVADAELRRAQVLWLPTVYLGADYFRHDGQLQDVVGNVFGTSKSSLMFGAGPYAVFAITDAIFGPLAARQVVRARTAELQTAANDTLLAVAEAYFNVQQARGELAAALDVELRAADLARRAAELAPQLVPPAEADRALAELARRRQAVQTARERWQVASADLSRLLRLDPTALVEPLEPPHLRLSLLEPCRPVGELIALALAGRPELAARQALTQAAQQQLRQERLRPLLPSVWLRGTSTPAVGTLAGGVFGGGVNGRIGDFSARSDFDVQLLWEWQNLGFGNRARVNARRAELDLSLLELTRTQELVAAEVVQAHARLRSAGARVGEAEEGVRRALSAAVKNFEGLGQPRGAGNLLQLVIRPQEAVAAVQALADAYSGYYAAVAEYNRGQFRLYRALGAPAQAIARQVPPCPPPVEEPPATAPAGGAVLEAPVSQPPVPPQGTPSTPRGP